MGINSNFRDAAGRQASIERKVKRILSAEGSPVMFNHHYMNFGKKVHKLMRNYTGQTLMLEVCIELRKWARRGLDFDTLNEIVTAFSLQACPPFVTYDFSYDFSAGAGTDKWAWKCCYTSMPPAAKQACFVEYLAAEYVDVSTDNSVYVHLPCWDFNPGGGTYATHQYMIQVSQAAADLAELTAKAVVWCSVGPGTLYIWNYTAGSWEVVGTCPPGVKTTIEKTFVAGFSQYVQGGEVWLMVQDPKVWFGGALWLSEAWIDYVQVRGKAYA